MVMLLTVSGLLTQTLVAAQTQAALDSLLFKFLVGFVTLVGSTVGGLAIYCTKLAIPQLKKLNDFWVTWYGDPNDREATGIKHKIEGMSDDVSKLMTWSGSYNRALGALAEDNDRLRKVWKIGDPERRADQKTPQL